MAFDIQVNEQVIEVDVLGGQGPRGPAGPGGTLTDNSGFTAGGPSVVQGDSANLFRMLQEDGDSVLNFDAQDAFSGYAGATTKGGGRLRIGKGPFSTDDAGLHIAREIDGAFSHGERIEDLANPTGVGNAYASYDAVSSMIGGPGSASLDHFRGYQSRLIYNRSGHLDQYNGFGSNPTILKGTVDNVIDYYVANGSIDPAASVALRYGLYMDPLSGATTNVSIFVQNESYLLGKLTLAGDIVGAANINASGQATANSLFAKGTVASYPAGGGIFMAGQDGGASAGIQAIASDAATPNNMSINRQGGVVVFGPGGPTSSAKVQVGGGIAPSADNVDALGLASFRFSVVYAGTGAINTSDERTKEEIGTVPDEWLDAWGDVQWSRFKFVNGSRWHIGLVAQRVRDAFLARGLDATDIGLLCFDQWDEITQPVTHEVEKTRKVTQTVPVPREVIQVSYAPTKTKRRGRRIETPRIVYDLQEQEVDEAYTEFETILDEEGNPVLEVVRKAGEQWGLRYDECFAMEAAYQRRRMDRLEAQLGAQRGS